MEIQTSPGSKQPTQAAITQAMNTSSTSAATDGGRSSSSSADSGAQLSLTSSSYVKIPPVDGFIAQSPSATFHTFKGNTQPKEPHLNVNFYSSLSRGTFPPPIFNSRMDGSGGGNANKPHVCVWRSSIRPRRRPRISGLRRYSYLSGYTRKVGWESDGQTKYVRNFPRISLYVSTGSLISYHRHNRTERPCHGL